MLNHSSYLPFSTSNNSFDSAFSCIQLESDFLLFPSSVSTPTASHRVINPFGKCFLHFTTAELRFGSSQARLNGCFMGWIQSVGSDACAWCLNHPLLASPRANCSQEHQCSVKPMPFLRGYPLLCVFGVLHWNYACFCVCLSLRSHLVQKLSRMLLLPAKAVQALVAVFICLSSQWIPLKLTRNTTRQS